MMQGSECAVQCQDATSAKAIGASIHFFFKTCHLYLVNKVIGLVKYL